MFDVIHLGVSLNSMEELKSLIASLELGGKLIAPIYIDYRQRFVCINKTKEGRSIEDIFGVQYASVQSLEKQLVITTWYNQYIFDYL